MPPVPIRAKVRKKKHPWVIKDPRTKIPRGYDPPRDTLTEARDRIVKYLESYADCVQGYSARAKVVVYVNPNDTIDAQVTVDKIPRGLTVDDLIIYGENCFHEAIKGEHDVVAQDYFIKGTVDIMDNKGRDTADRRTRGMNEYGTYWYRANHVLDMFSALRTRAFNTQRMRGKPKRIRLLMHWNVINLPPGGLVKFGKEKKAAKRKKKTAKKRTKRKGKS